MSESALSQINALLVKAKEIIEAPSPTRAEYADALELADAAAELAVDAKCREMIGECRDLQIACHCILRRSYSKTEAYEKFVYEKTASRVEPSPKRCGKVFEVDKGEHLVDALRAVHVGQLLEDRESEEMANRKIRFVDEVRDESIQQVRYVPRY